MTVDSQATSESWTTPSGARMEGVMGYRRYPGNGGVWHVMRFTDCGPGAVRRGTLCGRFRALCLVGHGRPESEWAQAKTDYAGAVDADPASITGVTCKPCIARAKSLGGAR